MNDSLKVQRCNFLPEGEMAIIKDNNTLIHNIVDSELKQKNKEIERLNNIIDKAKEYIKEHTDKLKTIRVPKIDFDYKELLEILGDKE